MLAGERHAWFDGAIPVSDFYFLMDVDVRWEDDGTRYFADAAVRRQFFDKCRNELDARNLAYRVLSGSWDEKFETALSCLRERYPRLMPGG